MTIKKNISGYYIINDIINNQLIEKKYLYFTRHQAIKAFQKYAKNIDKNYKNNAIILK